MVVAMHKAGEPGEVLELVDLMMREGAGPRFPRHLPAGPTRRFDVVETPGHTLLCLLDFCVVYLPVVMNGRGGSGFRQSASQEF